MRDFTSTKAEEATEGAVFFQNFFFVEIKAKDGIDIFEIGISADEEGTIFLESYRVFTEDEVILIVLVIDLANNL